MPERLEDTKDFNKRKQSLHEIIQPSFSYQTIYKMTAIQLMLAMSM